MYFYTIILPFIIVKQSLLRTLNLFNYSCSFNTNLKVLKKQLFMLYFIAKKALFFISFTMSCFLIFIYRMKNRCECYHSISSGVAR